jgi:hypothetical protein
MVRILNTVCVALMGLSILALYHVSEQARVASVELNRVNHTIVQEHATISVLQTEWERVAGPARIQELAAARLGLTGTPAVQMSSFDTLPRRGDDAALSNSPIAEASAQATEPSAPHSGL